jgi:hypothetical protein
MLTKVRVSLSLLGCQTFLMVVSERGRRVRLMKRRGKSGMMKGEPTGVDGR